MMITEAGTYRVGEKLKAGIYTLHSGIQCEG